MLFKDPSPPWAHSLNTPTLHGHPWPTPPTTVSLSFLYSLIHLFICLFYTHSSFFIPRLIFHFFFQTFKFNFQNIHFQSLIPQNSFLKFDFHGSHFQILNFQGLISKIPIFTFINLIIIIFIILLFIHSFIF